MFEKLKVIFVCWDVWKNIVLNTARRISSRCVKLSLHITK